MVMNEKMLKQLNEQINAEFWSAYLYLSMSSWFEAENLPGFAHWMYVQFQEEQEHAMKIFRYLNDRGCKVNLKSIDKVATSWKSPAMAFEDTLKHEKIVTGMIYSLMDTAIEVKDYATQSFLKWFVDEQVEEEATADSILQALKAVGDNQGALHILDKEFAGRQ
jgi:ferritin